MTDKELRRLNRSELLEILVAQAEENEILKSRLAEAEEKLQDRAISVENAGSIADAALSINGVFESAEAAAVHYLENVHRMSEMEKEYCRNLKSNTEREANAMMEAAEEYSRRIHEEADTYWEQVVSRTAKLLSDPGYLRDLLLSAQTRERELPEDPEAAFKEDLKENPDDNSANSESDIDESEN